MFVVYEGSYNSMKLARYPEQTVHSSWNNCHFNTFNEAFEYMKKWLGQYWHEESSAPKVNEKFCFYGDATWMMMIKEEK